MKTPRSSRSPLLLMLLALALMASPMAAASSSSDVPETVTFTEHVAPIFMEHCVSCHRPDDVAPMSLLGYAEARPWAKSIAKVVASRDMPPWDANHEYGEFSNDISLDDQEIALISRWVEQGAPQGDAAKMPAAPRLPEPGSWKMGREPDYVIDLAAIDVPADGPDVFVTQVYGTDIPAGKWVQAIELLPGNTQVLHHVVVYLGPFGMSDDEDEGGASRTIYLNEAGRRRPGMAETPRIGGVWVAGSPPSEFPSGYGHPLKDKQLVSFNMHYHPSGNAGSDASKLGIYFGEGEIQKEITTAFAADPGMFIPAGVAEHREEAVYLFSQDSQILSLLPHMHNRGKSMRYTLHQPDGSQQVLLDVPAYDYDWQNIYHFREPIAAPAGSLVEVQAVWDNSAENPANPDPTIDVPWGDGTNNEMMVAFLNFVPDEGTKPKPFRVSAKIDELLSRHGDDEHSYAVTPEGMGFGQVWGLVLPPEGEGAFYLTLGQLMFSTSIAQIHHLSENEAAFTAAMIASAGGAVMPLGFLTTRHDDGTIDGEMFFGREIDAASAESMRGKGRAFSGRSRASAAIEASSGGR